MIDFAISLVILFFGFGLSVIFLAWVNDRRRVAKRKRLPAKDPKAVLELRFAQGKIDEQEFNRRMHRLIYGPPIELD